MSAAVARSAGSMRLFTSRVAAAGGSGTRPVHELTLDGWERTMALNARTQVTTARAVLRRMLDQEPDVDGARAPS